MLVKNIGNDLRRNLITELWNHIKRKCTEGLELTIRNGCSKANIGPLNLQFDNIELCVKRDIEKIRQ